MKPTQPLSAAAQFAIAALVLLGWLGGSLILAHAGFETSPPRGGSSTFVPLPQAYVLVAVMYLMSLLALLALLRQHHTATSGQVVAVGAYASLAWWLVDVLSTG